MCDKDFEAWGQEIEQIQWLVATAKGELNQREVLMGLLGGKRRSELIEAMRELLGRIEAVCEASACFTYAPAPGGEE